MLLSGILFILSSMKKIILIIVLLVVSFVVYFSVFTNNDKNKSAKFLGSVRSVGENSVVILGAFEDEVRVAKPQYEYEIKVDDKTKIVKNSFVMPKSGEMFVVSDLPKETKEVDFDTLKKDSQNIAIGIEVLLSRNFLGLINKNAIEIVYIGPKY